VKKDSARSSRLWSLLKVLFAFVLAIFVVSRTEPAELLALRARIIPAWLAAALLFFFALTLLKALQYYYMIGRRVSYWQVLHVVIVQNAVSNFIATGAGIASYATLFRVEHGVKISRIALVFILSKVGDLISIFVFLGLASALVWPQIELFHAAAIFLLLALGVAIFGFFLVVTLRQRFVSFFRRLLAWIKVDHFRLVAGGLETLQMMAQQPQSLVFKNIGMGVLFSFPYMFLTLTWMYACLQAFSLHIAVWPTVFVNTLMQVISYLPIQVFGGLGLTETSMLYLYGPFDLDQAELAAVLIGIRVLFYLSNLAALLYLPLHSMLNDRPRRKGLGPGGV
jgi:uncharacterized membrane protein YbhN (UPF0104 family)